jgi:antitoxin component of RelBE/YafQ-DinJ toxin-antitoxin module
MRIDPNLKEKFEFIAKRERLSLSQMIQTIVEEVLDQAYDLEPITKRQTIKALHIRRRTRGDEVTECSG